MLIQMTYQKHLMLLPEMQTKETPEIVKATGYPDNKEINRKPNILTNINS